MYAAGRYKSSHWENRDNEWIFLNFVYCSNFHPRILKYIFKCGPTSEKKKTPQLINAALFHVYGGEKRNGNEEQHATIPEERALLFGVEGRNKIQWLKAEVRKKSGYK